MNLKILSYNIHKGKNWGSDPEDTTHIQSQLHTTHSDIVLLQEVRGIQSEKFKSDCYPYIAYGKNVIYRHGNHGNAILSRFPISYSENIDISMHRFERRSLLHAMIQVHYRRLPIHILCTHLGLFKQGRIKQLEKIMQYIGGNISEHEPIILGGDFNDWLEHATETIIVASGFHEVFLTAQHSYAKTFPSIIPILKLDRIYYRGFSVDNVRRLIDKSWKHLSDHVAIQATLRLL